MALLPVSTLGGAVISGVLSAGINVAKQVVIDKKSFSEINWKEVAIEGASSFVSSALMDGFKEAGINLSSAVRTVGKSYLKQGVKGTLQNLAGEEVDPGKCGEKAFWGSAIGFIIGSREYWGK